MFYNRSMSTPILTTKLYIPLPRSKIVLRPRLSEHINEGLRSGCKLTLISASAGFGKTTLVSNWLNQLAEEQRNKKAEEKKFSPAPPHPNPFTQFAWFSLDEGDNDLTRFLVYLVAALQTIAPNIGEGMLAMLQSPQPSPTESILTTLLNEIAAVPNNFILVLDDYHVIETQAIDQALTFLLEHQPPQMHLVIATREDPPLPLARLRVRGQMTELRAVDLRFTPAEATGFLNQGMGLSLSTEDITALEARTEGWIAGLQMAALALQGPFAGQGSTDTATFIHDFTGSHRFVLDYLVEEVLQRQPEYVRNFLLQTAILDRLNGSLCDAVRFGDTEIAQHEDGRGLLQALERGNLFIVPLDNQRQWYRYHHLFADVLHARLMENQPKQVPTLHQRASEWYEQNNLPAEAIHHALAAKDFERTAALVELIWPIMDGSFQTDAWLNWVKALPDEMVRARPVLSLGYAWSFLNAGELEAGEARLRDAEQWLDTSGKMSEQSTEMVVVDQEQFRSLPASIATARAYIAQALGDGPNTVKYAQQVLDLLPEDDYLRRGPSAALLGITHWVNGELEAAYQALNDAMTGFQKAGNIVFAISGTYGMADIKIAQGRLHEAVRIYEQSLQLATTQAGSILQGTADLYLGLAQLHYERGNLAVARQNLLKSEALGEQAALPDWPYRLCLIQARMKKSHGEFDDALDLLNKAERLYYRTPIPNIRPVTALQVQVWLAQGRLAEALSWVQEQNLSVDDDLSYLHEFEHMTLARVLITQYKDAPLSASIHEAIKLLEGLLKAAEVGGRAGSMIEIFILQALAHQTQDDIATALVPLAQALTLAEPEGYCYIFVDEGQPMAELLTKLKVKRGRIKAYIAKLLAAFEPQQSIQSTDSAPDNLAPQDTPPPLIEPLTPREREVLQLIAVGRSNPEIAAELVIAVTTVKTHVKNIYGKLQVGTRFQAAARAKELNLL